MRTPRTPKEALINAIRDTIEAKPRISRNEAYDLIGGDRTVFKNAFHAVLVERGFEELSTDESIHPDFAHLVAVPVNRARMAELHDFADSQLARLDRELSTIRVQARSIVTAVCDAAREAVADERQRYASMLGEAHARADASEDYGRDVTARADRERLALLQDRDTLRVDKAVLEARVQELERAQVRVEEHRRDAAQQAQSATQALERAARDTSHLTRLLGNAHGVAAHHAKRALEMQHAPSARHRRKPKGRFR